MSNLWYSVEPVAVSVALLCGCLLVGLDIFRRLRGLK